jgi:hypothetical protein
MTGFNIEIQTPVYFNIRNTLPKSGTFLLGHSVYDNALLEVTYELASNKTKISNRLLHLRKKRKR